MMLWGLLLFAILAGRVLERWRPSPWWADLLVLGCGLVLFIRGYIRGYRKMKHDFEKINDIVSRYNRQDRNNAE